MGPSFTADFTFHLVLLVYSLIGLLLDYRPNRFPELDGSFVGLLLQGCGAEGRNRRNERREVLLRLGPDLAGVGPH